MMRSVICAMVALGMFAGSARAQESRAAGAGFFPFVGCWRADSVASSGEALSCVVPMQSSADVELVNVIDGRIADRQRIAASGRPSAVDDQGCRGEQQASSSSLPRRVYLRAEFICAPNGMAGGQTTLMSILPSGERLDVESIRSGVGSITRVQRFRDAGVPASLPRDIAMRLGKQRLAVMTARAEAASPLQTSDVIEALHHTDSSVVRAWLVATAQHFQLSGEQVAALVRAEVPAPVLQAMLGAAPAYQLGVGVDQSGRNTDAYLNSPGTQSGGVTQMTTAGQSVPTVYENANGYDACCVPMYSGYDYYAPGVVGGGFYPGLYSAPYVSYYSPYALRRYPSYYGPIVSGRGVNRPAPAPAYYSNPVGVRPGQHASPPQRQVPSRRRP
jgi:hypothetical protein